MEEERKNKEGKKKTEEEKREEEEQNERENAGRAKAGAMGAMEEKEGAKQVGTEGKDQETTA